MSALSDRRDITEIAVYLENDINHWRETLMEERTDPSGPDMTAKGRALTRQQLEQRRSTARADLLLKLIS